MERCYEIGCSIRWEFCKNVLYNKLNVTLPSNEKLIEELIAPTFKKQSNKIRIIDK